MAVPRFFSPVPLQPMQTVELPPEIAHHAIRVLRLAAGADIVVFDGQGGEYPAVLAIEGKKGYARTGAHRPVERELQGEITLAQGIAAGDKMDWIIEKSVELGASRLVPITAARSVLQLSGERLEKRRVHWDNIARAASIQCGRNQIMQIDAPASLEAFLKSQDRSRGPTLFCHPEADLDLAGALDPALRRLSLLVGPEGGWSDNELASAERAGLIAVRFGTRVLRTETAGLALIAACSALLGWN